MIQLHYTVHYNYEDQLHAAIHQSLLLDDDFNNIINQYTNHTKHNDIVVQKHAKMSNLPSCQLVKEKPGYSLFRIEITHSTSSTILSTWVTSSCLELLDAKDNLYKYIELGNGKRCMPTTVLLPYDTIDLDDINKINKPYLLKGALGSGGFGIYFVKSSEDILSIMKWHRTKAEQAPGFLDSLHRDFGRVPLWSLQEFIPSVRVNGKRCQIRVYVVVCEDHCYFYHTHEVRLPSWDCDLDDELLDSKTNNETDVSTDSGDLSSYDKQCCLGTTARPYNKDRNKKETHRFLTTEIDDISNSNVAVNACIIRSFNALKPYIQLQINEQNKNDNTNTNRTKLAIAGVDLVLQKNDNNEFEALIVELNNNPSMVGLSKKMSTQFSQHLKQLLSDIVILGLSKGKIQKNFSLIW